MNDPYESMRSLLSARVVAFHPDLARALGGIYEALFFQQIAYWSGKGANPDWIYKTREEIAEETCLTRYQQEGARKNLIKLGVMEEERRNVPARLYYRVNWEALFALLHVPDILDSRRVPDSLPRFDRSMTSLTADTRRLGGRAVGSRGSGKTLYAAYQIYQDLLSGTGSIVIDPMGTLTSFLFSRIAWGGDVNLWKRVVYVPLGGMPIGDEFWVVPTPLLFTSTSTEVLQDRTQRVVDMWKRLSPQQESAPIQGMPSIEAAADHLGMLLSAMGKQLVPDASRMLEHTEDWVPWCEEIAKQYPYELTSPLETVKLYADPKFPRRDERSETLAFLRQIGGSTLNPRLSAQYGANEWGVNVRDVEQGKLILFDCSNLTKYSEKRMATTWVFSACMEYFRSRKYRRDVISFVIDELSFLADRDNRILEQDFEDLIMRLGRNYGIAPFITYQKILQPSERMQTILNDLGYSFFGAASDRENAAAMVDLLDTYEPYWVKDTRQQVLSGYVFAGTDNPYIEEVDLYYSSEEQDRLNQVKHRERQGLHFALAAVEGEGQAAIYRGEYSFEHIRDSQNFDSTPVEPAKALLVRRHGRKVDDVIVEIEARMPPKRTPEVRPPRQAGRPRQVEQEALPELPPVPPRNAGPPPRRLT